MTALWKDVQKMQSYCSDVQELPALMYFLTLDIVNVVGWKP